MWKTFVFSVRIGIVIVVVVGGILSGLIDAALITYGRCESPFGQRGFCMLLTHCPHLVQLVQENHNDVVKNSYCGPFRNHTLQRELFCCWDIAELNTATDHDSITATTATVGNAAAVAASPPAVAASPPAASAARAPTPAAGNVLPAPGVCGVSLGTRIFGGIETHLGEYPWTVLIKYKRPYNATALSCAGALINTRYVLSAAHCIRNPSIPLTWQLHSVRLGEWNINTNPDCVGADEKRTCAPAYVEIEIERIVLHVGYIPGSSSEFHDIALLRLAKSVVYSAYIRPVCLPTWPELRNRDYVGTVADVAGWGQTEIRSYSAVKKQISIKVWDTAECERKFAMVEVPVNRSVQLCAGGTAMEDTCRGDSGAPLIMHDSLDNKEGGYFIIGVVSFGMTPCGMDGWPGIYTRVSYYVDWIQSNLEA